MSKRYYVYIMTNLRHTVFYTGITNDIQRRLSEHGSNIGSQFVRKYNVTKCLNLEEFENILEAIAREKQIKGGSRQKKITLINRLNPEWKKIVFR